VTDDTGTGNPTAATAAKGAKFLEAVTQKIGGFLVDLSSADTSNLYE
jgi:creatinine amidohydrolase